MTWIGIGIAAMEGRPQENGTSRGEYQIDRNHQLHEFSTD